MTLTFVNIFSNMASSGLIQFRPKRLKIGSGAPLVFEEGPYLNIFHLRWNGKILFSVCMNGMLIIRWGLIVAGGGGGGGTLQREYSSTCINLVYTWYLIAR
jgi:hypothetical protein